MFLGSLETLVGPLADQATLKLGNAAHDGEHTLMKSSNRIDGPGSA
jgi:hypothetical protein